MTLLSPNHPWATTLEEAKAIQDQLRSQVIRQDHLGPVNYVAGTDVGFEEDYTITKAAVVVLRFPSLELVESQVVRSPTLFPYIPGFLSFREVPALLRTFEQLKTLPDLILCDGQGIAHPRRFGLACHLGVLLDRPTIGVAKSRLIGTHTEVAPTKGSYTWLYEGEEVVGAVLRSRDQVKPIYVSIGHRITLPTAMDFVWRCITKYRLPETTRWADRLASQTP
ncbi:deoxyribonuclease V [Trichothermofontia sichuanensis B231]|uniref:deoxyribonuclease V n=1 Tax=Trichothermofontia sichuanensis TaxID=3045816 RepID=UPI00224586F8|nr:deoxyribonuclease V [Trichothermofontia sichuanensis]UZQ54375.1 deoxyribonuclease V [Trichothermofontia sichuanensis B231]